MLPWIIAQIRRGGNSYKVTATLEKCCLEIRGLEKKLSHQLSLVARLGVYPEAEGGYLIYGLRDREQPLLYCHLLWSADIHDKLKNKTGWSYLPTASLYLYVYSTADYFTIPTFPKLIRIGL
ncbi:unnamed protein product [Nezara viridula]|uniref:Uncharacterized protein n=1 Tax=Nezara viridula TaxID=85310 RepID=A0A9P0HQI0_NEZVI|nr:unnamed protein product [Nezara viridula]